MTNELGGSTSYLYDVLDRVIQEYAWDEGYGNLYTEFTYDSMGRVTVVREHDGTYRYNTYHPTGEVARTWGTRTYPVEYEYEMGRLKTLTTWQDFAGETGAAVTTWIYDSERGWLNQKKYADDTGPVYTYTAGGRLASRTWARGVSTGYDYDNAGRLVAVDYSDSTADVAYSYDRLGRRLTTTDGTGTRTDTHDVFGRLQSESYGTGALLEGWALNHAYDSLGRRSGTSLTHGASTPCAVAYGYDDASRLASITKGLNTVAYNYHDDSSRVWQQTYSKSAILLR